MNTETLKKAWSYIEGWDHIEESEFEYGFMFSAPTLFFAAGNSLITIKNEKIPMIFTNEPIEIIHELFGDDTMSFSSRSSTFFLTKKRIIAEVTSNNNIPEVIDRGSGYDSVIFFHFISKYNIYDNFNKMDSKDIAQLTENPFDDYCTFDKCWSNDDDDESPQLPLGMNANIFKISKKIPRIDIQNIKMVKEYQIFGKQRRGIFIGADDLFFYIFGRNKNRDKGFKINFCRRSNVLDIGKDAWDWMQSA